MPRNADLQPDVAGRGRL